MAEIAALSDFSPDWAGVLDALAEALHRVQVRQLVPTAEIDADGVEIDALAGQLRPEVVQLWYQMALHGRRDLGYAPSPRAGFEMTALRMLAFRPAEGGGVQVERPTSSGVRGPEAARAAAFENAPAKPAPQMSRPLPPEARENPAAPERRPSAPPVQSAPASSPHIEVTAPPAVQMASTPAMPPADAPPPAVVIDSDRWLNLVANSGLRGPARELAAHAAFLDYANGVMRLALSPDDDHLRLPGLINALTDSLGAQLGGPVQLRFETGKSPNAETLHQRNERQRDEKQASAEENFMTHPDVQRLVGQQGAKLVPDSIRPYED